jgi:hypothetical protein
MKRVTGCWATLSRTAAAISEYVAVRVRRDLHLLGLMLALEFHSMAIIPRPSTEAQPKSAVGSCGRSEGRREAPLMIHLMMTLEEEESGGEGGGLVHGNAKKSSCKNSSQPQPHYPLPHHHH